MGLLSKIFKTKKEEAMPKSKFLYFNNHYIVVLIILILGCDSSSKQSAQKSILKPTSFTYSYEGDFGIYDIADAAEAFNGNVLLGKARAIELQEAPNGGAKMMKIEATHYSPTGEPIYKGYVFIQAGFSGGKLIKTEDINGDKQFNIFGSWQFGH